MSKTRIMHLPFSPVRALGVLAITLAVAYIALIAVVMNYAALTVGFAESVRNDEAAIASLESSYFSALHALSTTNYSARGFAKPIAQVFVKSAPATALR